MEKKSRASICLRLFSAFFMIGAFTFGGGYAMIPLIRHEVCEKRGWICEDDMPDIIAIAESTPGPLAINTATFVGFRLAGVLGAAAATIGVVLPSFLVISIVSTVMNAFSSNRYVLYAFRGIRAGVLALIIRAMWSMFKKCPKNIFSYILMATAFGLAAFTRLSVVYVILGCGTAGFIRAWIAKKGAR